MRKSMVAGLLSVVLLFFNANICAKDSYEAERAGPAVDFVEGDAWREQDAVIPPFPNDKNLIKIDINMGVQAFDLYLDPTSVSIGEDAVVRYLFVLRSSSGAENVFFEGIRCETGEYKSYATGSQDKMQPPRQSKSWQPIRELAMGRYRYQLYRQFFCYPKSRARPLREIIQRARYGTMQHDDPLYNE